MALTKPEYIEKADLTESPIKYKWDANSETFYLTLDEKLRSRIKLTSKRGVIALSLGFAEWIAFRFEDDPSHQVLLSLIEAGWACEIDWRYLSKSSPDLSTKEWQGPVQGPIRVAYNLVWDVLRLTRTNQFASPEAVCLSRLALYVLPKPQVFKDWRESIIQRLAISDPNSEADKLGKPIPREAIDPLRAYEQEEASEMLTRFVRSLDPETNPCLATPESMKGEGFEGTPYPET